MSFNSNCNNQKCSKVPSQISLYCFPTMTPTASIVLQTWLFVHYSLAEENMPGQKGINMSECLIQTAGFCLPDDYDNHVIPRQSHDPPLKVNVEFFVEQITEINDKRFTISIVMRLALYWRENRIVDIMPHRDLTGQDVPLTYTWTEKLWYWIEAKYSG